MSLRKKILFAFFGFISVSLVIFCGIVYQTRHPNPVGPFPLQEIWSYEAKEKIATLSSSVEGITILRSSNFVTAIDSGQGIYLWSMSIGNSVHISSPQFYENIVFVANDRGKKQGMSFG
jgi:hypothetical protein